MFHIWISQQKACLIYIKYKIFFSEKKHSVIILSLTLKHQEMHGCVVSTVATDALVLKHQAISIHNAD